MENYEYTEVNRLEKPHNYMYTPYFGVEFVQSYFDDRSKNIEKFKARKDEQNIETIDAYFCTVSKLKLEKDQKLLPVNFKENVENIVSFNLKNKIVTEKLLTSLLVSQLNNENEKLIKEWLDRLVQRFEVTKKIYETYLVGFRKGRGSTGMVRLYWIFALLLALYYSETKNIKYLNTLLKVNDLLCSLGDDLIRKIPIQGLELVLSVETEGVQLLAKNIEGLSFVFE
jgi:hypothetical protein